MKQDSKSNGYHLEIKKSVLERDADLKSQIDEESEFS